ncbi:hypothetical protein DPMN_032034 [Dreissena polymorpha]|uniref:Uncharacterized protein n=1 Tax=Dreissena polymorpha TaxID=45954 RepID=A0A9D4M134_DREPO|nr:hypothetical protein DPMN_032034 [Dreissena polymorpha]
MGHALPKVQCGVSVSPLPVESVAEGTLTGTYWPRYPHNRSLKSRLSLGVGDPPATKLGRLVRPDGPRMPKGAMRRLRVTASGELKVSPKGTLTRTYGPVTP